MTTAKNLECFFKEYENIVSNGLEYNYSEKEIYNAIYKKEFNNYLRKGIHPRLDELNLTINFVRKLRSGELEVKSESNTGNIEKNNLADNIRNVIHNLDLSKKDDYNACRDARFEFIANEENDKLKIAIENIKNQDNSYYDKEIISNKGNKLVHDDGMHNITIGYGFNTNRPEAKD